MACDCPVWLYGNYENKVYPRQSTNCTRLEDAQVVVDVLTKNGAGASSVPDSPTIGGCITKFLPSHESQIKVVTLEDYARVLYRFEVWCRDRGVLFMKDLTVDLLETFRVEGLTATAESTRRKQFLKLKRFLREAFRRDWLQTALYDKLPTRPVVHEQKQPYSKDEVEKILATAAAMSPTSAGYGAKPATFCRLLELMLATGMRVSDAVGYDPHKIMRSEHFWIYSFFPEKRQKTAQPKLVEAYVGDRVKTGIDGADWYSPSLPFKYGSFKTFNCTKLVYERMQAIGKVAGIEDCRPHRLRDTFAVRCLQAGVPLEDVSRLLGHSSVQITEKYYAAWTKDRKLRLERILAAANPNGESQGSL